MTDDYYFEEKPSPQTPEITPEWEEPDPGGHGGAGWGSGSGWGPGSGGGISWHYPDTGGGEPSEPESPEAETVSEPENGKILKRSDAGMLLRCSSGHLLLGDLTCSPSPHFRLWIRGEGCAAHTQCVLWKLSDGRAVFEAKGPEDEPEEGAVRILEKFIFLQTGRFELQIRWQGGHYDHARVREMRIVLFGLDLGWKVYPLDWITAADVLITPGGEVYVNGIRGTI